MSTATSSTLRRGVLLLAASMTLSILGCRFDPGPPDVILVSIDTLRPDHLGAYGYPLPTSPNLDAFRHDAVLFSEVIAQAPSTLPSHASLFTSLLPQHHGASHTFDRALPQQAVTVAERFRRAGYRMSAVVAGGQMAREYGLDQGFDVYQSLGQESRFAATVRRGLDLLDATAGPGFLFLHSYEVHHPYTPNPDALRALGVATYRGPLPADVSVDLLRRINHGRVLADAADRSHIEHAYDAEIRSMDAGFGLLVQGLREKGRYRDSVIVLTSDHGEEFAEHGTMGWHSHTLYDELLRVPLLIKLPREARAGTTVGAAVRSLDVAPTLLAVAGLDAEPEFSGRNLLPWIDRGKGRDLPAVSWRESPQEAWSDHSSLRRKPFKLVGGELYDLEEDPGETLDLASELAVEAQRLEARLGLLVSRRTALEPETTEAGAETLRELRALGYLR